MFDIFNLSLCDAGLNNGVKRVNRVRSNGALDDQ